MNFSPPRSGVPPDVVALARRLSVALFAAGAVNGLTLAFFPLWLSARGLDSTMIGLISALPTAALIVVNPPVCAYVDRRDRIAAGFVVSCVSIPFGMAAMGLAPSALWIVAAAALAAVARAPWQPLGDALAFALVAKAPGVDYGRIRVWLSVSVLAAMAGGGFAVERVSPGAIIWMMTALTAICAALALLFTPRDREIGAPAHLFSETGGAARPSRTLVLVIAAAALVQGSHGTLYAFGSLGWRAQGASDSFIGMIWATGVAAEIGLFWAAKRIGVADKASAFLVAGAAAATARWVLSATLQPAGWGALMLQASHLATYGATHLGTLYLAAELAPKEARAQAQGWINSAVAAATMAAILISGPLWRMGPGVAYGVMAGVAACGLALAVIAAGAARGRDQPQRLGSGG